MKSLKTIEISGKDTTNLSISASVNFTGAKGFEFMRSLEAISIQSPSDVNAAKRLFCSVSISNDGSDLFMKSLRKIEAISGYARAEVEIDNRDEVNDGILLVGDNCMGNLETIRALSDTLSQVKVRSEAGLGFMGRLSLIEVSGSYSEIQLKGLFSTGPASLAPGSNRNISNSITIDTRRVGGASDSLAFVHTHEFRTDLPTSRPLALLIGSSNVQYNAVYEVNTWNNYEEERDGNLFTFDSMEMYHSVGLYKDNYGNIQQFNNTDSVTGFYTNGFAGIDRGGQAVGWSALGSNGVQDILKFTSYDSGNVVVGGFDNGLDRFDFSALRDVITGQVIDQTNSDSHAATQRGDILVTKINTNDAMMWINSGGGTTNAFEDFESWVYVVGGANMTWNSSDFIF